MPTTPEVDVWIVDLELERDWLPAMPAERERADRLAFDAKRRHWLRSHAALREILRRYTDRPLDLALRDHGKPYLPAVPDLHFNLSHCSDRALVAVSHDVEVGVDVERLRPLQECLSIAERFFPPGEAAALAESPEQDREAEFFRCWTRIEAKLKATGMGLYGAGAEPEGAWTVLPVEVGAGYVAALAACCPGLSANVRWLGRD